MDDLLILVVLEVWLDKYSIQGNQEWVVKLNSSTEELGNAECFEAMGNGRQIRDKKIGNYGSVNEGTTMSMENRNNDKDEIGESADQNDVVWFCSLSNMTISMEGAGTLLQERAQW